MQCGISTACFYPEDTLLSLNRVIDTGSPVTEIFFNTFSELEDGYLCKLEEAVKASGIRVSSIHPFSSAFEGFMFATDYTARTNDGIEMYRRYCEICSVLGADKIIFHGERKNNLNFPLEKYYSNLQKLMQMSAEYGVSICYENVFYCRLGTPEAVEELREMSGNSLSFTLDLKQLRRSGYSLDKMLFAMRGAIKQVHISDLNQTQDCIPPGLGTFDFENLVQNLRLQGYAGDFIIELYRDGFSNTQQLIDSMHMMQDLIDNT